MKPSSDLDQPGKPSNPDHPTLEAWSQGMMVGTLVFMIMLTVANMRRRVILHKLILVEVRVSMAFVSFLQALIHSS